MSTALAFLSLLVMIVFACSLLYLIYAKFKSKPMKKAGIVSALSFVAICVCFTLFANSPEQVEKTKQQKEAADMLNQAAIKTKYLSFCEEYYGYCKNYELHCGKYKSTLEQASNAQINVYQTYNDLDAVKNNLDALHDSVGKMVVPKELDEKQADQLKDALWDFKSSILTRIKIIEKTKECVDSGNFSPSKVNEIKELAQFSDNNMLKSFLTITTVSEELGFKDEISNLKAKYLQAK